MQTGDPYTDSADGYGPDVDANALNTSLRGIAEKRGHPLRDSLQQVIDACVQVFAVTGSGLMIADDQSVLRYAVATDGPGRALEDIQLETGEGPCVQTFVTDDVVVTEDLAVDERWPRVAERVGPLGVRGMLGVPVRLSGIVVGSLDVYRDEPHQWDRAEQRALARYADVVGSLTETALAAHQAGELAQQLNYALDHRVPIERGIGYLMARDSVGHAEAFNRLRRAARSSRRKIGNVAEDLLDTGRLPHEQD
jgi:GAF domain-containing protein